MADDPFDDDFVDDELLQELNSAEQDAKATPATSSSSQGYVTQPQPRKIISKAAPLASIIVSQRQKGNNVVLGAIRNVPWEYGDIVPDYVVGTNTCVLFLSLKYHRLHPEYVYGRIAKLGKAYTLRILLIVVDIENHSDALKELTKTSFVNNLTIILAWSPAEAGHYLGLFKSQENAQPTKIQAIQTEDYTTRVESALMSIRGINKSDALGLISSFGSIDRAVNDNGTRLSQLAGWGDLKVNRFLKAVNDPFILGPGKRRKTS